MLLSIKFLKIFLQVSAPPIVGDRGRSDGLHGGKTDLVFFDFLHKSNEGIVVFMGENSCCMCILYFSEVVEFGRRILLTCL